MSSDRAVDALVADGSWAPSPVGACGVRRMVRGRVAEGLVRLVREVDAQGDGVTDDSAAFQRALDSFTEGEKP